MPLLSPKLSDPILFYKLLPSSHIRLKTFPYMHRSFLGPGFPHCKCFLILWSQPFKILFSSSLHICMSPIFIIQSRHTLLHMWKLSYLESTQTTTVSGHLLLVDFNHHNLCGSYDQWCQPTQRKWTWETVWKKQSKCQKSRSHEDVSETTNGRSCTETRINGRWSSSIQRLPSWCLLQTNSSRLYLLFGMNAIPNILYSIPQVRFTIGIPEVAAERDQQWGFEWGYKYTPIYYSAELWWGQSLSPI